MAEKYAFEKRLGGGGMAEVFLARTVGAEGFQRPVAIKRVLPSFSLDAQFSSMFINEARLSALLRHANIVQVLDFDRDAEGRLFLVMELVEGRDLSDVAERGALPIPVVVYVIGEVLKGLAHAHDLTTPDGRPLGIVHRDISPHNVLVSWDGTVKVSDFGIAKAMLASGAGRSATIKGKPLYMAPEQVTSPDTVDHRADLFAVGVMMFELLTGQRIYQGTTNEEVLTDVIQVAKGWRQLTPAHVLRPDLPHDLAHIVMGLLAPDRQQRFAHARDAFDALVATTSASPRGAEMLADVLAERFPGQAPARNRRRAPLAAMGGPTGPTQVVTPAPAFSMPSAPAITPIGTPTPPPTMTVPPAPGSMATVPRAGRRTWPLVLALVLGLAGAAVVFVMTRSRSTASATNRTLDAAPSSGVTGKALDAAPTPVVVVAPDAGPEVQSAAATVAAEPAVTAPDAGVAATVKKPSKPTKPHTGRPTKPRPSGETTIHEVQIEGK